MDLIDVLSAAPIVVLIIGEYFYVRRKKLNFINNQDAFANIVLGIIFSVLSVFFAAAIFKLNEYLYQFRFFDLHLSIWSLVALVILDDFINYVSHRILHENRFFWAVHEVHHSSEHFNYSTAIRLTIMTSITIWPFWIFLPFLGFKTEWIFLVAAFSHMYGGILHTQTIGRLGFLEKLLVTPSHHRVHHGKNTQYLDSNYGIIFIFWDKLFGTFAEEKEKVEFGILTPGTPKSPILILVNPWIKLFQQLQSLPNWKTRFLTLWHSPGWSHDGSSLTAGQLKRQQNNG